MELSEHESLILQEIEQTLTAGDPRLARALSTATLKRTAVQHLLLGATIMGLGVGVMVFALALGSMPVGAVAFASMTAGAYVSSARVFRLRTKNALKRKSGKSQNEPDQ
ncbi:hypothetical protein JOF48_003626 [Arthrobacter stackebrandtii]|uniref:DUF3040 domain-containing protein n=1 Tax=Arthrobacter stackebrandtii TaxID=272161 RepID=A0ABS4Z197_9MICC|nr:DUF3040 domain-containing protein [Arthrobacter stackebrandtii]MBP2414827.1 hypothetical protein [Arthrobacter stackebrandtii]